MSLLNLFFLDKEIDPTTSKGVRLFFGREAPFFLSYYLGAISAFGVSLWLYFSSLREKITLLGLVAASLIVALGGSTPIYPFLFRHLPLLGGFRFPEKFFFFTYVLLIYMTLKGLGDLLLQNEDRVRGPSAALATVCAMWLGLYIFFDLQSGYSCPFHRLPNGIRCPLSTMPKSLPGQCQIWRGKLSSFRISIVDCLGKDQSDPIPSLPFWLYRRSLSILLRRTKSYYFRCTPTSRTKATVYCRHEKSTSIDFFTFRQVEIYTLVQ